jgi:hypothetical protein
MPTLTAVFLVQGNFGPKSSKLWLSTTTILEEIVMLKKYNINIINVFS